MSTCKLAKILLPFLKPLTQNTYTITDSFHFTEEISKQDANLYMASLDDVFRNLLTMATKESFFMFNSKFYKQIDGVAMRSPLGPALANTFMCRFENKWLKDCPHSFKPSSIDGILMIYLYCFPLSMKQESLKCIFLPNIPT